MKAIKRTWIPPVPLTPHEEEMQADFADSVVMEELPLETIPAELLAEFEESAFLNNVVDLISIDVWESDFDAKKQETKR